MYRVRTSDHAGRGYSITNVIALEVRPPTLTITRVGPRLLSGTSAVMESSVYCDVVPFELPNCTRSQ